MGIIREILGTAYFVCNLSSFTECVIYLIKMGVRDFCVDLLDIPEIKKDYKYQKNVGEVVCEAGGWDLAVPSN